MSATGKRGPGWGRAVPLLRPDQPSKVSCGRLGRGSGTPQAPLRSAATDAFASTAQAGFTLLEMMVTVAILALITGIVFPRMDNLLARRSMTEARGALALALARAHADAVRRDRPSRVTLSDGGDRLQVAGHSDSPLPPGAFVEWPRQGVVVYGDGSSSGARGMLRAGALTGRFAIDPATARLAFAS